VSGARTGRLGGPIVETSDGAALARRVEGEHRDQVGGLGRFEDPFRAAPGHLRRPSSTDAGRAGGRGSVLRARDDREGANGLSPAPRRPTSVSTTSGAGVCPPLALPEQRPMRCAPMIFACEGAAAVTGGRISGLVRSGAMGLAGEPLVCVHDDDVDGAL
jgi:hypothetical protein